MTGNAAHWFVDRHIAEGRGAKTAFEEAWEGGCQLTYGALAEGAGQVADALMRSIRSLIMFWTPAVSRWSKARWNCPSLLRAAKF